MKKLWKNIMQRYEIREMDILGNPWQYIVHQFGPTETIEGIVRKVNDESMTKSDRERMLRIYNVMNSTKVPLAGQLAKIPLVKGHNYIAKENRIILKDR